MINYEKPITRNGIIFSIDNVVADFSLTDPKAREALMSMLASLMFKYGVDVKHWQGTKPGTFREQFSVSIAPKISFWVGVALNGASVSWGRCRVEFNPNKVGRSEVLEDVLEFLVSNTRRVQRCIKRYDLAIDIPVERDECFLIKDRRLYIERRHGQEFTQYLGAKSSAVGRVKLYNKALESDLSHPLTRLELTLDPTKPLKEIGMPKVLYLNREELPPEIRLTDSEKFILHALLQGCGTLNDLGRKTRAKMEIVLADAIKIVKISAKDYATIIARLEAYVT